MWTLHIDYREAKLIEEFKINNFNYSVENLTLGDIVIKNDNEVKCLFERKTINDLAASIVDGRYKEQSFRLSKALDEGFKVFYFIEGNMDLYTGSISKNTLISTVYSLTNKGFQVLLTKNSKETACFVLQFAEKMKKNEKDPKDTKDISFNNTQLYVKQEVTYENTQGVIQTKKNKNITKDNISVFMLCQIPGISTTTAGILLQKYGHLSKMIIAMKENPNEIEEFRNNNKKLNKNIIQNLNEYLRI